MKRERNCQLLSVRQTEREKEDEKSINTTLKKILSDASSLIF